LGSAGAEFRAARFGKEADDFHLPGLGDSRAGARVVARLRERSEDGTLADSASQELMLEAADEIERLHERLENNRYYDKDGNRVDCKPGSIPDGTDARDETIRLLRAEIARLQRAIDNELTAEAHTRGEYEWPR
jgi:hypothetical protein